ncbi:MAG: HAMP domain-containing protein [alpha proteobacterium HIMB114]|nr:MAG: HAMP domain-containing protein [alpha proteobacterium HIMB114]
MKLLSNIFSNTYLISILFIISIGLGFISLQTFIGVGFFKLNQMNVEILLILNLLLLFTLILSISLKIYKNYLKKKSLELGGKTSKNLVLSFLIISSLPSFLIVIFSIIIFNYGIQKWFDDKILSLVNNSRNIAINYLNDYQKSIVKDLKLIAIDLNRNKKILLSDKKKFKKYIQFQANFREIKNIFLINNKGKLIQFAMNENLYNPPTKVMLLQASNGKPLIISNALEKKTYALIKLNNYKNLYLYSFQNVDKKINSFLKETGDASTYYFRVKSNTLKIQISFFIIYIIFTLILVLMSAIFGINLAAKTTKPLNNLFRAAKSVSEGNYDIELKSDKNEDFRNLNLIFNDMVSQIKKQKQKNILSGRFEAWQVIARKLAHEIRNPLTPIQLSLDRIKDKISGDEGSKKHLSIINNQIFEISKLVNSFSDFARMPKPIFEKNDILEIVNSSIETYQLNYEKIKFIFKNLLTNTEIYCDKGQINRALLNVYKNAIESIEEKSRDVLLDGKIITELSEDKKFYFISIYDDGVGFKESGNFKHNDPYFTTKKDGSGLGLSIVSKIVHEHNGQIFYENRKKENGALVSITIPKKI